MNEREVLELMRDAASGCDTFEDFVTAIHNKLAALPAAAQADGEEPTVEDCRRTANAYANGWDGHSESAIDLAADAVRSLMLRARPAPSHALVEAADAMWEWGHVVLDRAGDVGNAKVPFTVALDRYDLARSSLPAAKKEGA